MKKHKDEIFTTVDLAIGRVDVLEGKGIHFFNALTRAKGDSSIIIKTLILELVVINGKKITEPELNEMLIKDVSYLTEIVGNMMSNHYNLGL